MPESRRGRSGARPAQREMIVARCVNCVATEEAEAITREGA